MVDTQKTDDINYMILGSFLMFAIPNVIESILETGQELSINGIVTELNKIQNKYTFDNKIVETFIDNLSSNTQAYAMTRLFSIFLIINNVVNKEHFVLLKSFDMLKGVLGKLGSKVAKGKFKKLLGSAQNDNALVVQGAINNRLATWQTSSGMATGYASGSSLMGMNKSNKINNLKNPSDVGKAINGLYTASGYGTVVK